MKNTLLAVAILAMSWPRLSWLRPKPVKYLTTFP